MSERPGASTTVDGILYRPTYAFVPPDSFFEAGPVGAEEPLFNVLDFGAVADPGIDNRPMIQAAIDAAHAAGGGMVYIPPGTYGVAGAPDDTGGIYVLSNVFLKGAGMGESILRVVDGWDGTLTGIVRTPFAEATTNYGVADLTLDGNRDNTSGKVDGYFSGGLPGGTIADEDAYILRVEAENNSGYGFDPHEQTIRLSLSDSVAHHNGLDGFEADFVIDSVYSG